MAYRGSWVQTVLLVKYPHHALARAVDSIADD